MPKVLAGLVGDFETVTEQYAQQKAKLFFKKAVHTKLMAETDKINKAMKNLHRALAISSVPNKKLQEETEAIVAKAKDPSHIVAEAKRIMSALPA
eukprot:7936352-Lingulodinium_polyedra.AAC.1